MGMASVAAALQPAARHATRRGGPRAAGRAPARARAPAADRRRRSRPAAAGSSWLPSASPSRRSSASRWACSAAAGRSSRCRSSSTCWASTPKPAIAMSLVVVGAVSLLGAIGHWRAGNVNLRVALIFGVRRDGGHLPGRAPGGVLQRRGAAGAVRGRDAARGLLHAAGRTAADDGSADGPPPTTARMPLGLIVAEGIAVGVLTGLVGVGGGFLIVPALVILGHVPMKEAVGTSLLVIAMKSLAGSAGYLGQVEIPLGLRGRLHVGGRRRDPRGHLPRAIRSPGGAETRVRGVAAGHRRLGPLPERGMSPRHVHEAE